MTLTKLLAILILPVLLCVILVLWPLLMLIPETNKYH